MAEDARLRVLEMLAAGEMTAEEAAGLLEALGRDRQAAGQAEPPPRPRTAARHVVVSIGQASGVDDGAGRRKALQVRVPLALARFAARFLPAHARDQLDASGVDLNELLDAMNEDLPDGKILDMEVGGQTDGGEQPTERTRIVIEVA